MPDQYGIAENCKSDAKLMPDVLYIGWHVQLPYKFTKWIDSRQPESLKITENEKRL